MLKIVADENMPLVEELFSPFGLVQCLPGRNITNSDLKSADILLVRSVTAVNASLIQGTPIKFVGSATIGTDHIEQEILQQANIQFAYAPGCNAQAVAEYVLCAIAYWAQQRNKELSQISVGIIGAGNVGTRLSHVLERFGIRYLINDPPLEQKGDPRKFSTIKQIQQCDIISCHVPLLNGGSYPTYHMVDKEFLLAMPGSSLLINSARGAVVDNNAALMIKRLGKNIDYVFDVWEGEPELNIQLLEDTLIGTPHIAGYSFEGKVKGTYFLYQQLCQWLGQDISINLQSLLPRAKKLPFPLAQQKSLHNILSDYYDITEDDKKLRLVKGNLTSEFDRLRKNYKTRLEFF